MNPYSLIKTLRDQLQVENELNEQDNYEVALQGNEQEAQALVTLTVDGIQQKFIVRAELLRKSAAPRVG